MSLIRCLFLGTPDIAASCLKAMIADEHFEIVGVVSQPDRPAGRKMQLQASPVKSLALQHKIPVWTPEKVSQPEVIKELSALRAEVVVVVAFGQILTQEFLDAYPNRIVNVHASILPRWRGAAPIQRAIMAGDRETGVSLQVMVKKLDAGAILGSRKIKIEEHMNSVDLLEAMKPLAADLLAVELMDYCRGNLGPLPQDESLVTIAPKIEKSEGLIDWSEPAQQILNKLRGLAMGPGVHTRREGKPLKIHRAEVVSVQQKVKAGQVIQVDEDSFIVSCGGQALKVLEVQPESRARMSVKDYLKGYSLKPGDHFASS